ncbi:unnamed protein product [Pylaiella littoralis]
MSLPVLIAGSLSGVIQYPAVSDNEGQQQKNPAAAMPSSATNDNHDNGGQQKEKNTMWPSTPLASAQELAAHAVVSPMLEAIEDGAQSLLESLEASSTLPASQCSTPREEEEREATTARSNASTMTASSASPAAAAAKDDCGARGGAEGGCDPSESASAAAVAFNGDDFDDPATCGTLALRRLCICGLGFALLPPAPAAGAAAIAGRKHQHGGAKSSAVAPGSGCASGIPDGGGRGGGGGHGGGVEAVAGAEAIAGGTVAAIAAPRRGSKGTCMISVSDLRKAQARSFGHAKRRARITAGIDENRPPPAVKRSVGFNDRMKAAGNAGRAPVGSGTDGRDGGHPATGGDSSVGITNKNKKIVDMGNVLPEAGGDQHQEAEVEAEAIELVVSERDDSRNCLPPGNTSRHDGDRVMAPSSHFPSSSCQACGRVVLGHPLDTISARCGGIAARDAQGGQPIGAAATLLPVAGPERVIAVREGKVIGAAAAAADAEHAWKQAAFANLPKSAGGTGSGELATAGCPRGRRNSGVGASAISRALGDKAVETLAGQLGHVIQGRRQAHDSSVARLAEAHARFKEAKELKVNRKVDFRRRLAAAANEAREEIETIALRRRLSFGGSPSSQTRQTGGGDGGSAAPVPGDDLRDDSKWDEDGFLKEPDAAMIEAAAAAASASSIARWNQQQRQEQEQRLRQLMVEMKDAIKGGGGGGGGGDADGCRPTLRRGSSSVDSRGSSASGGGNVSGRGSISGSGIYRDLAQGADATHSAILSSMRDDGVDARVYLHERRAAFHGIVAGEEEKRNAFLALPGGSEAGMWSFNIDLR